MSDLNNEASVAISPIVMYVLILSYIDILFIPYVDLVDVFNIMQVVKSANACMM
jgi:hypothetical protein